MKKLMKIAFGMVAFTGACEIVKTRGVEKSAALYFQNGG